MDKLKYADNKLKLQVEKTKLESACARHQLKLIRDSRVHSYPQDRVLDVLQSVLM
jgi:hypothetical protein